MIISSLNKNLFWDVQLDQLDNEKHKRFIIERILHKGDIEDWKFINTLYGHECIKKEVVEIRYMNDKTLNYLCIVLDIPKDRFRCYNTKVSTQKHWVY